VVQRSGRILFIADVPALVDVAAPAFSANEWDVTVAAGVEHAMSLTHRGRFDLVVCGALPSACAVREFVAGGGTSIVVLSEEHPDDRPRGIAFLARPRSIGDFRATINKLLDERRVVRPLASTTPHEIVIATSTTKARRSSN
jgi:DNA-binding response OmpR family regulator